MLLVAAGCASEPTDDPTGTGLPAQTAPPSGGTQPVTGGTRAPVTTTPGASGSGATTTGSAGIRAVATGGAGASSPATAGSAAAAGASGSSPASAGAGGAAGALSTAGATAAGSGGASGAAAGSGSAGKSGSGGSAAGTGGSATGGTGGSAGAAGSASEREDLGEGDGTDVVLLGDSWMSNTLQFEGTGGGIAPSLIAESGQRYRNYGVQGVELLGANSFGAAIPTQWDSAKRVNAEIKTVVMTAGGNDVIQGSSTLQSSCLMGTDECRMKLKVISDALDTLWTKMADDGVQDIVHIRYSDNTGTLHPDLQGNKGFVTPKICESGRIRCHSVPTTDLVAASDLAVDGIHPLGSANDRIATRTYELMVKEGLRR